MDTKHTLIAVMFICVSVALCIGWKLYLEHEHVLLTEKSEREMQERCLTTIEKAINKNKGE